ncbi:uncharacterized protein PV06_11938, partial [Exophiala oligosperma]
PCKVCTMITYSDSTDADVLTIKWGNNIRDVNGRDHIATRIAADAITVPVYKNKGVVRHGKKYVSISIRSFIKGQTLESIMSSLDQEDIDAIMMQITALTWELAKKTSQFFGHIQDGSLRTTCSAGYIRTRVLLDKLAGALDASDCTEVGTDPYVGSAVFCHGNLSPEHIIVNGATVVGVVGWSEADFVPEIYDRLKYFFKSNPKDPQCWYRKVSDIVTTPDNTRPSVEFVMNTTQYVYKSSWSRATPTRKAVVTQLWKQLTTNYTILNCLATAEEAACDNMSLSSLTSWSKQSSITVT